MSWRSPFVQVSLCVAVVALLLPSLDSKAQDQSPQTNGGLSFDAVSIKELVPGDRNFSVGIRISPGRLTDQCANLKALISFAYNLGEFPQILNLPDWGGAAPGGPNNYDVQATMPANTTSNQARQMMQTLLADRFELAVHRDRRDMPVFALVIAKGGFKGKPYDPKTDPPLYGNSLGPCPEENRACHELPVAGAVSNLANLLSPIVGRPVVDKTNLEGSYNLFLKWAGDTAFGSPLPSLATALRETLGLELKSETAEVNILVIDHAEKPTPN
ncbi:MAG TPA: TIGR03435 family protein [Candidatus Acidoferrales bacterium]|nr:TIGR03435 family protein [Candidatus Acidoferrales bacterium]